MPDVLMPRLSDSMEQGVLLRWLKRDGEHVRRGEEIAEIETDKATMPYEADADGVLHHGVEEGVTCAVGARIGTIGEADDPPAATSAPALPVASGSTVARSAAAGASPVARRVAQRLGVALAAISGSGPGGRIVKADVVAAAAAPPLGPAVPAAGAAAPAAAKGVVTVEPATRVQQTIARRMAEAKATVPDFAVERDVDMEAAVELREQLRGALDPLPSLNDLIVKAVAAALRAHPRVNGAYRDGAFERFERVNVGVAVAAEDALLVPVVADADRLPLGELARATRRLAERGRAGMLTPPELAGGTFTISNLGMLGVDRFAGIVNPPQAAILCVGAMRPHAVVGADGALAARRMLTLTLVCDHRILYGADAAAFLADVAAGVERPLRALV